MQLNNIYLKHNELSIHSFMNGFSFSTINQKYFFPSSKENMIEDELKEWIAEKKLLIPNAKLILFNHLPVIIPQIIFDEKKIKDYLLTSIEPKKYLVKNHFIKKCNQVIVYYQNLDNLKVLKNIYPKLESKHFISILLEKLSEYSKGNSKKQIFVNLRKDFFDIFLYQSSQLLLYNSFSHKNEEDFLYYLFYIIEVYHLKPNEFKITFLGKYSFFENYYLSVKDYHSDIYFLNSNSNFENIDTHQAPFFCNIYK